VTPPEHNPVDAKVARTANQKNGVKKTVVSSLPWQAPVQGSAQAARPFEDRFRELEHR
jgi:hypothetical protein